MSGNIMDVTDKSFDNDVTKASLPVLVDFWAPWCGPCKAIGPVMEAVSLEYAGRVRFAKCNVDENQLTPASFGIRAIPTLILFKGGQKVEQIVGMVDKSKISAILDKHL